MSITQKLTDLYSEQKVTGKYSLLPFVSILIEENKYGPLGDLRWDILRSVISDNRKLLIESIELNIRYDAANDKEMLSKHPEIIGIVVMRLHTEFSNFGSFVDTVKIHKEVFDEQYPVIEKAMCDFLENHISSLVTKYPEPSMIFTDFIKVQSKYYLNQYKNYYYLPVIENTIRNILNENGVNHNEVF